ncbi:hypothetical protein CROQUDRAFT_131472 [Cronartium quercuum f. sp. fusiforme G11]|uniref:AB hydrolase-1 domain-containing protein n=1 Tax=Cronartium quercuum f. sp. fusiforme G11 TaxID=708437 RepID=A0A9P6NLB1_9BASI|nr:hypothetical protein CROQUDRAFT_131472 [Cronartium quercuum f. sp. fusiforme G11]
MFIFKYVTSQHPIIRTCIKLSGTRLFHTTNVCPSPISLAYDHYLPSGSINSDHLHHHHPIIILHGLFGSRQNWKTLAKRISQKSDREVFVLDLRNHGDSGVTPGSTNYLDYASDVEDFIKNHQLKNVNLIGHSMGGKVAMSLALGSDNKSLINKLVIVDISPLKGRISEEFQTYLKGMKEINSKEIKNRKEADQIMSKYSNDVEVRQFLLKNLKKIQEPNNLNQDSYKINLPLEILTEQISTNQIGDFPFDSNQLNHPIFSNPTLFIKGKTSPYINHHSTIPIKKFFPNHQLVVFDAGHWVQAEKPVEFIDTITKFFNSEMD